MSWFCPIRISRGVLTGVDCWAVCDGWWGVGGIRSGGEGWKELWREGRRTSRWTWFASTNHPWTTPKTATPPALKPAPLRPAPSPGSYVHPLPCLYPFPHLAFFQTWFCSLPGHEYFCEVAEEFIEDDFNLTGTRFFLLSFLSV